MPTTPRFRTLVLPGWQDSGPDHWQTLWERRQGFERVQQSDWWHPLRGDWMMRLEEEVLASDRPVRLVAHSLGCHLAAAWAAHSRHATQVRAALLVAPPDLAQPGLPPQLHSWRPVVTATLPFPALVVRSLDDPFDPAGRANALAAAWGAAALTLGRKGHINAASGLGDWPAGLQLLDALIPDEP